MFLHKYAIAIGWPVPLLKKIMSAHDIAEAMAYDSMEPFGPIRDDFRSGIIASTIANVHRGKGSKVFTPLDFVPKWRPSKNPVADKIKAIFKNGNNR